ncbi:hypothetical protein BgiMline_018297 [Biomphalaria glabrata]|nr:hypothetical protein BgiMline_005897 [Biomphalaria glabrata]
MMVGWFGVRVSPKKNKTLPVYQNNTRLLEIHLGIVSTLGKYIETRDLAQVFSNKRMYQRDNNLNSNTDIPTGPSLRIEAPEF